jgi:hypothetical protein
VVKLGGSVAGGLTELCWLGTALGLSDRVTLSEGLGFGLLKLNSLGIALGPSVGIGSVWVASGLLLGLGIFEGCWLDTKLGSLGCTGELDGNTLAIGPRLKVVSVGGC